MNSNQKGRAESLDCLIYIPPLKLFNARSWVIYEGAPGEGLWTVDVLGSPVVLWIMFEYHEHLPLSKINSG